MQAIALRGGAGMTVTLEQARKALPKGYQISDEELASVIADAYVIANLAVSDYLRNKREKEVKQDD